MGVGTADQSVNLHPQAGPSPGGWPACVETLKERGGRLSLSGCLPWNFKKVDQSAVRRGGSMQIEAEMWLREMGS